MQRGTNKASCLSVPGADKATSPPALPAHPKLTLEVCMVPRKCPQDWRCSCDCRDDSKSYKHGRRACSVSIASDIKGKSYSEKLQPFKLGLVLSVPWPTATFRISLSLTSRDTAPLRSLENMVFSLWIGKAACLRSTCLISRRAGDTTNEESQKQHCTARHPLTWLACVRPTQPGRSLTWPPSSCGGRAATMARGRTDLW